MWKGLVSLIFIYMYMYIVAKVANYVPPGWFVILTMEGATQSNLSSRLVKSFQYRSRV